MPSDLMTVAEMREHVATGLTDAALERVMDAQDDYIIRMVGPHDPVSPDTTLTYVKERPSSRVSLPRKATSIESVTVDHFFSTDVELDESYYRLEDGGLAVFVYDYLTVGSYYDRVTVEFVPEPENDERKAALVALVQLAIQDTGLMAESDDTFRYQQYPNRARERKRIVSGIRHYHGGFAGIA